MNSRISLPVRLRLFLLLLLLVSVSRTERKVLSSECLADCTQNDCSPSKQPWRGRANSGRYQLRPRMLEANALEREQLLLPNKGIDDGERDVREMGSRVNFSPRRSKRNPVRAARTGHDSTVFALCHTPQFPGDVRLPACLPASLSSCLSSAPHFFPGSDVRDAILSRFGFSSNLLALEPRASSTVPVSPLPRSLLLCAAGQYILARHLSRRSQNRVPLVAFTTCRPTVRFLQKRASHWPPSTGPSEIDE